MRWWRASGRALGSLVRTAVRSAAPAGARTMWPRTPASCCAAWWCPCPACCCCCSLTTMSCRLRACLRGRAVRNDDQQLENENERDGARSRCDPAQPRPHSYPQPPLPAPIPSPQSSNFNPQPPRLTWTSARTLRPSPAAPGPAPAPCAWSAQRGGKIPQQARGRGLWDVRRVRNRARRRQGCATLCPRVCGIASLQPIKGAAGALTVT
jgi:hypothetical protein